MEQQSEPNSQAGVRRSRRFQRREGVLIRRQVVVARVLLESSMSSSSGSSTPASQCPLAIRSARATSGPMSSLHSSSSAVPLTPFWSGR